MLKKIGQAAFFFLLASAVAIFQSAFIFPLPSWGAQFNLVLVIMIFSLFFFGFTWTLVFALSAGFWFDLIGFNFFGLHILVLFLTLVFADRLLAAWLTNRSLYSFILLILLATGVYNLLFIALSYPLAVFFEERFYTMASFWSGLAYQSAWSLVVALLLFNLVGLVTRRLQPFFLEKD